MLTKKKKPNPMDLLLNMEGFLYDRVSVRASPLTKHNSKRPDKMEAET